MNKHFYIRYFNGRFDDIPVNSDKVCWFDDPNAEKKLAEFTENIYDWMRAHPGGKTDIVVMD